MDTQSWLYTRRNDFGEFDLHLEYWTKTTGNSGVSIRDTSRAKWAIVTPPDYTRTPSKIGYEIQINNRFPDPHPSGSIYGFVDAPNDAQHDDDWNAMDISSRNDTDPHPAERPGGGRASGRSEALQDRPDRAADARPVFHHHVPQHSDSRGEALMPGSQHGCHNGPAAHQTSMKAKRIRRRISSDFTAGFRHCGRDQRAPQPANAGGAGLAWKSRLK